MLYRSNDAATINDMINGTVGKTLARVNLQREARSEARSEIWAKHQRLEARPKFATVGSRRGPNQALSCVTGILLERLATSPRETGERLQNNTHCNAAPYCGLEFQFHP